MTSSRALVLALSTLGLVGSGAALAGTAGAAVTRARHLAPQTASAVQNRAIADARAAEWVHATNVAFEGGTALRCAMTSSLSSGTQTCSLAAAHFRVEVASNGDAYVDANAVALRDVFRFSAAQVGQYAGHWLGIASQAPGYASIAYGVTLPSILSELLVSGHVHFGATKMLNGVKVTGIIGTANRTTGATGQATLWVRDDAAPLPVEWQGMVSGKPASFTLGGWRKPVHIAFPANFMILSRG